MPEIEITEECRALIAAEFPFEEPVRRLRNGECRMQIDAETWQRLQKVRGKAKPYPTASSALLSSPSIGAACDNCPARMGKGLVLPDRIELSTSPLPMECSTTELRQHARY